MDRGVFFRGAKFVVTDLTAVQTAQLVMLLVTNAREKATIVHNVFLNLFPLILQQQSKSL